MLVLDVLDNWVPALFVVDLVAVAGRINNVHLKTDTILLNDMGNNFDLGCTGKF